MSIRYERRKNFATLQVVRAMDSDIYTSAQSAFSLEHVRVSRNR